MKGRFIIIVGPSASGKTELVNALLKRVPRSARLVTVTTRPPRPGERDGEDYFFVSRTEFEKRIAEGEFLEYAEVYGNLYGQSKKILDAFLRKYRYVFAIIDVKGAQTLKAHMPESFTVFIRSGSLEEIRARLRKIRVDISEEELERRLATVAEEMTYADAFDASVTNVSGKFPETIENVMRRLHKGIVNVHMQEQQIDRFFKISVFIKGITSLFEIMAGIAVLYVPWSDVAMKLIYIAQGKLAHDPDDLIAIHLIQLAHHLSVAGSVFFGLYLLSRGIVKFGLVIALLKRYLWAYPLSMIVIGLFMVYQIFLFITTHSGVQAALVILDLFVLWFVWKEYKLLKRRV